VNLDATLDMAGIAATTAVIGLLLYRRVWRVLPIFCVYCVLTLLDGILTDVVLHRFPAHYLTSYFIEQSLDSALQFCVLVELAWAVFRPYRTSLPRSTVWVLGILLAAVAAAIWPFAGSSAFARFAMEWRLLVRLQQTVTVERVLFFLVLAGCSQLLSIGWRDREMQVATGFGFYSLVALSVAVVRSHQAGAPQWRSLDRLVGVGYLCSLLYWVFCFAQKEAERREFSPQMQGLLLAMAGVARTSRVGLNGPGSPKSGKR
jgi:hypothetical protein